VSTVTTEEFTVYSLDKTAEIAGSVFRSELGWMAVAVREGMLCGVVFGYRSAELATSALGRVLRVEAELSPERQIDDDGGDARLVRSLAGDLQRYAAGEPVDFRGVAINQSHLTPFGRRIIAACRRIPFGQTRSYGQLAAVCGSPGAARAVGQAMAKNRFPLVVPCHRVLGAGGRIGGFSAPDGLRMKRRLLSGEGAADVNPSRS
jgi:methylated-DNA-[protein]-cysteine S-methyltransferase